MSDSGCKERTLREEVQALRARLAQLEHNESSSPRLEAIAMMAGGVAHEVNNLMATILGTISLLREESPVEHAAADKLEAIERAAELAGNLTQKMLSFTQGGCRNKECVNLNTIVYRVLLMEEQRLAPRVRIVRYMDPDLWPIQADHAQVSQLVLNLAINAVEAISGQGRVIISTRNLQLDSQLAEDLGGLRPGKYVYLSVEDNGCGMSKHAVERLFDPSFSTKSKKRGLGAAIAYHIANLHAGRIEVNSTEGTGTVVRVYLPAQGEVVRKETPVATKAAGGDETILLVDDDKMLLAVTRESLTRLGYNVVSAYNGQEAIDILGSYRGQIQLALLDMTMPVMSGMEAFPLLRAARPDMKIIVYTGLEDATASQKVLEAGASAFLLKPLRPSTLVQEIRKALDGEPQET